MQLDAVSYTVAGQLIRNQRAASLQDDHWQCLELLRIACWFVKHNVP